MLNNKEFDWNSCKISKLWCYYDNICGYLIKNGHSRLFYLSYDSEQLFVVGKHGDKRHVCVGLGVDKLIKRIIRKTKDEHIDVLIHTGYSYDYSTNKSYGYCYDEYEDDALLGIDLH